MTVSLKHSTTATGTDAGNGEIAKAQWNEEHALTGTPNTLLAFDGAGDAAEVTPPAGDLVGTTATQTLTNKTLTSPVITEGEYNELDSTLSGTTPVISGTGIRRWTLTGNSTPTSGLTDGDSVTLLINDGSAYTITWTMVDLWIGGAVPELDATNLTVVELFRSDGQVIGAIPGVASAA